MKQKNTKLIMSVCCLVLLAGVITGVSVFAKGYSKTATANLSLKKGDTKKLQWKNISKTDRKNISWKSSDSSIASVDKNGKLYAKKTGTATITAKYKKQSHKYKVTINSNSKVNKNKSQTSIKNSNTETKSDGDTVTTGTQTYRGFIVDNVLHSKNNGNIHYNVYIPNSYDGTKDYALYITLPGYQGLYFQGVAQNIKTEDFGFEAQKYNENMIIVAPQLDDWDQTSADQTIALTEYFLKNYKIDSSKVYINGYSGGGETLSLVLGKRPELYTAALMCSSQWDGAYEPVVKSRTPVYFVIGENDEYYSSDPFKKAYQTLYDLYKKEGLSKCQIDKLLVLDVKGSDYFAGTKVTYQHGGGYLFCRDKEIMGWLFNH